MISKLARILTIGACFVATVASQAITFSNVTMTFVNPALGNGAFVSTSGNTIDFTTPSFSVGDGSFGPDRAGMVTISYEATSDSFMASDRLVLAALGGLLGTGMIEIQETVYDMINPGVIAALPNTQITNSSQLPFVADLTFSRQTTHLRAEKIIKISAPESASLDFARIGLIEQQIGMVPEPGSMLVVAGALGAVMARRRRAK